ncbi:MAG TPA: hypothetical protein VM532_15805, partial [Burkholderiales bacterium]|nr:hypothetical protein [Burkholderiales bacterium]
MPNNKQPDIIAAILRSEKYEIDEGKNNLYAAYERGQKKFISLLQEEAAEKSFWEARIAFVGEIRELWPKKNEQQGEKKPHQIDEEVEREIDLRQKQAIRDHILDEIFFDSSLTLANKLATLSIFLGKLDQFSLRGQESGRGRDIFDQICPAISKALNRESIPKDLDADSLNHLNALADRFKNLTDGVDGDHGLAAVSRLQNSIIFWKGLTLAEHEGFTQVRSRIAEQCKSETFELLSGDDLGHFFNLARAIHQAPDDPMCDQAADRIVQHVIDSSIVGALQSDQDIACFAKYYSDCMHPSIYDDPNLPIFQFPIGIKKFVEFAKAVSKIAKDNEIGKKALEDLSHIFSITIHVKGFVVEDLNHVAEFADICSQFQEYGKCVAALDEIGKVIRRIPADRITAGAAPALFSLTRSFERLSPNVAFRDGALDHLLSDVIPAVASNLGSMDVQAGAIADFLEHISSDITPAAVSPADWSSVMTSAMANFSEVGRRYLALPHIAPEQKLRMLTNYATISAVEQDSHDDRRGRTSLIVQDFKLEELTSLSTEAHANVFKLAECCHPYVEEDKNCEMAFSAIVTALWRNPAVLENKGILPETLSRAAKLIVNSPKEGKDSVEGLKTVSTLAAGLTPLSDQDPNLKSAAGWIASLCNPETIKQLKGDELVCFFPVSGLLYRFGNDHACGKADKEMIAHVESADLSGTAEKTRSLYARYCMDHKLISSPDLSPEDEIVKGAQILAKVKPLPDTDKNLHDLAYAIATEFNDLSDEDVEGITQEQIAELDECFTSLHATPFRHSASDAIKEYFEAANRRKIEKRLKEEALESAYRALPESYNLYNDAGKHFLDCLLAAMPHLDSGQLFMYVLVMNNEQVRDGVSNEERIAINRRGLAVLDAAAKRYVDISRKKASASALSEVSGAKSSLAEQTSDMSLFMRLIARRSDKSADCRAACVTIAGQFADYAFKDLARVAPNDLIVLVEVLANLSAETTCARALDHLLTYFSQMNHELITSDALELFANEAERI